MPRTSPTDSAEEAYIEVPGSADVLIETDAALLRAELTDKQGSIEARLHSLAKLEKESKT